MRLPFQRKNQPAAARDSPKPLRSDAFLLEAMDAWGDVVYRVALAQTGSPSDADDVFQDVFMRLLEHDTAFESDEHLKAWLLRVTVNRCRDLARLTWNRRTEGFTGCFRWPFASFAPGAFCESSGVRSEEHTSELQSQR